MKLTSRQRSADRRPAGRTAIVLAAAVVLLAGAAAPVAAADSPGGSAAPPDPTAKIIVRFRQSPGRADAAAIVSLGGSVRFTYRAIPALAATVPEAAVTALLRNPNVLEIERDHTVTALDHGGATGDLEYENQWGVEHIGAKPVHDAGITGTGVRVAVIDTGIDHYHTNLTASPPIYPEFLHHHVNGRVPGWDFVNNDDDPFDDNGHGTHVAGILAAEKNGYLISGVAPDVDLFALKILGASGEGDYSALIAALDWAIDNDMDVVNMSLGGREVSSALAAIVAAADAAGVVMVAAAGNVNPLVWQELFYGCPVAYPAAYPQVLATTFTNGSDGLTGYSCTGTEVDFASPGDQIVSTVPVGPLGSCMFCDPNGYSWQSGTSMASPHLAGVVALVLDHGIADGNGDGRLMPEVKAHLCANTVPGTYHTSGWTDAQMYGCGVINARKALVENPPETGEPPVNADPVATDDDAATDEDLPVAIDVLANDTDADQDTLAVSAAGPPANGAVVVNPDGTIGYAPAANWHGVDTFSYTVDDGHGGTASGVVTVTVAAVNDPPVAAPDSATTAYQTSVAINVLGNDADVEGDLLSVTAVGPAAHGTVSIGPGGSVTYTPDNGFSGQDTFAYTVSDGSGTANGLVTVTVGAGPPAAPVLHVADLDGSTTGAKKNWTATVRIRVVDQLGAAVAGASVTGSWSGVKGTVSCTTDATGWCQVTRNLQASKPSVTFTVTGISRTGATYNAGANSDPDPDSNGTAITLVRP